MPLSDLTAPQATTIAAVVAGLVASVSVWQKTLNDRRDQWWKRAQWAIDKSFSDGAVELALDAMEVLRVARGVPLDDLEVLRPAIERLHGRFSEQLDGEQDMKDDARLPAATERLPVDTADLAGGE